MTASTSLKDFGPAAVAHLAVEGVRRLRPYEPGKPVETLEKELGIRDSVKLASNENPLGPSPLAVAAMRDRLDAVSFYPDGNGFALKEAIARRHGLSMDCVTIGNGSNDILELLARTFLSPGKAAVYSAHAFAVYPIVTTATGAASRVAAPHSPDAAMPYGHHLENLYRRVDRDTRLVFVANPNNPTGTWLTSDTLQDFVGSLPSHVICVVDEAYAEYVSEPDYPDTSTWLERFPRLVVTRTFSKIFGLAGLRVGYGLSHPGVAELLNRVRQPFNVNLLAQDAARAALGDGAHLEKSRGVNDDGLAMLASAFGERGLDLIPSVANFICVDVGREALPVYDTMLREGVIVRPVANYGFPDHLRITVGTRAQNLRMLAALDKALQP
ncbi:MAG: histidinol-phosphate transaminase [Pseudomonadota bacterium]|nr:histidinol-phosphate transaminase [Pseudomonadota bacterium]